MIAYKRHILLLVTLLTLFSGRVSAQGFDILSVEAGISDHKRIRSILIARSTVEQANELLHQNSKRSTEAYKDINVELDKYTRCFDIIDIIYTSAALVFNVRNTYDDVSQKIEGVKDLMERYKERVLEKQYRQINQIGGTFSSLGNIHSLGSARDWYNDAMDLYNNGELAITAQDTIIFKIGEGVCKAVYADAEVLINSLIDLALYATGAAACSTENIMTVLTTINETLDHIRLVVDQGYLALWKYIHVRTGYWTRALTPHQTIRQICEGAFGRWQRAQHGPEGVSAD